MRKKILLSAATATVGTAALGLAIAASASAHVTIRPDVNTSGSYAKVTMRVPNESDTASTTEVRLDFPENTFGSVRVLPHPGWTAEIEREQLDEPVDVGNLTLDEVIRSVTWVAEPGTSVGPDEFDEFAVSLGPLPEPGTYVFPAHQTYDNGEVVAWDMQPEVEDASNPAPTLEIIDGDSNDSRGGSEGDNDNDDSAATDDLSDGVARGLAAGGIVVGVAGVGVGLGALRRSRA
jgi:uncharacterized protein YcnI